MKNTNTNTNTNTNNMKNYIINSFVLQDANLALTIYEHIKLRYDASIDFNKLKTELRYMIKNNLLFFQNNKYELTTEGRVVLNDHKNYYLRIINRFFRKYSKPLKKYALKEVREEQQKLRNYLMKNKQQKCIICDKRLPACLLETAHLKPRCLLNYKELKDCNNVEFMCRYCHTLYDTGFLGLYNGLLRVSSIINNNNNNYDYDLHYVNNTLIAHYNPQNKKYFDFQYKYIYKGGVVGGVDGKRF